MFAASQGPGTEVDASQDFYHEGDTMSQAVRGSVYDFTSLNCYTSLSSIFTAKGFGVNPPCFSAIYHPAVTSMS